MQIVYVRVFIRKGFIATEFIENASSLAILLRRGQKLLVKEM
jgi:sRNA-binding regulator protein Hfq